MTTNDKNSIASVVAFWKPFGGDSITGYHVPNCVTWPTLRCVGVGDIVDSDLTVERVVEAILK